MNKMRLLKILTSVIILTLLSLVSISADSLQYGYDNPDIPHLNPSTVFNISNITHNSLTGLQGTGPDYFHLNSSEYNSVLATASNLSNVAFVNKNNTFQQDQFLAEGKKLYFLNNESYFIYNSTAASNGTKGMLQLYVNGHLQQEWGNSTNIYGLATFYNDAIFQNISGDGMVINTNIFVVGNLTADVIIGANLCYSDGTNCSFFNYTIQNLTDFISNNFYNKSELIPSNKVNQTGIYYAGLTLNNIIDNIYTWLTNLDNNKLNTTDQRYNDTSYISLVNQSLTNLSTVKLHQENLTITTSGGIGGNISSSLIGFLITEIKVTPSSLSSQYRLNVTTYSGSIIDQDRALHTGVWDIEKNYAINEKVVVNITSSNPSIETYTININYIDNFRP